MNNLRITFYNVANTADDKPDNHEEWLDALESCIGEQVPDRENMVGGHVSSSPYKSGPSQTEYIAAISKEDNAKDNSEPISVDARFYCSYDKVKNSK